MRAVFAVAVIGLCVGSVSGQTLPAMTGPLVPVGTDSGLVQNTGAAGPVVVYTTDVRAEGAAWLRLKFGRVVLSGSISEGTASYLRITSLADGAFQYLNAESIKQWVYTSAYMNGEAVMVELLAYPGTGPSRVAIESVTAGPREPVSFLDTICGPTDDRLPSQDPRVCRVSTGCTGWLINDKNNGFLTAGHCGITSGTVMMFNVPLSTAGGGLVNPPPQHQYAVDGASIRTHNGTSSGGYSPGHDHAYYGCFPNSTTGKTAFQAQGAYFKLLTTVPAAAAQTLRITGCGTTSSPISPTWNQVQKTHTGAYTGWAGAPTSPLSYTVDTTGGNSGSPVFLVATDEAFAIHGYGGCTSTGGANQSSSTVNSTDLQADLAAPAGVNIPTMASCYADCNDDNTLTVADFGCFQSKFAAGDVSANCNGDVYVPNPGTAPYVWAPKLDVSDFGCFQTKFVVGCP